MSKNIIAFVMLVEMLQGCMGYRNMSKYYESERNYIEAIFVDDNNKPIKDSYIEYAVQEDHRTLIENKKIYLADGILKDSVLADKRYGAVVYYKFIKNGYCGEENSFTTSTIHKQKIITVEKNETKYAKYSLFVMGLSKEGIDNSEIIKKIIYYDTEDSSISYTNNQGILIDSIGYESCQSREKIAEVRFTFNKDGYYSKTKEIKLLRNKKLVDTIYVIAKTDYLEPIFLRNNKEKKLVNDIISFIDLIVLRTYLTNNILQYYSIKTVEFKSNKYLTFSFQDVNEYNLAKLDKYDIGKRIFDEAVRKILNPLNDYISESKEFNGYLMSFNTSARNFVDDNDKGTKLVYDYYIPKKIVSSYKNLDITGQQVLDNSIILLDGERIDLKLQ